MSLSHKLVRQIWVGRSYSFGQGIYGTGSDMAKKGAKQKKGPGVPPERAIEVKAELPEAFLRRVRLENIKKAIAEGRLDEAQAYIQGYLSRGLLSQADVSALQAELARGRSNA